MSRVLLFVQTGDGRPKSRMAIREYWTHPERFAIHLKVWSADPDAPGDMQAAELADRWWLVECKDADDGRRKIMFGDHTDGGTGRILASGGKERAT